MAPASKKAKIATGASGISHFFGSAKPAAKESQAPQQVAAAVPPAAEAKPSESQAKLSEEQRLRLEENKRKALEKKRAREASAAEANGTTASAATESTETKPKDQAPVASENASPAAPPAAEATQAESKAEAQKQRIEENKRKALEKKKTKEALAAATSPAGEKAPQEEKTAANDSKSAKDSDQSAADAKKPKAEPKGKAKAKAKDKAKAQETKTPTKAGKGELDTPEKPPLPNAQKVASPCSNARSDCKFENVAGTQWMQYDKLYQKRLDQLSGATLEEAQSRWSQSVPESGFISDLTGFSSSRSSSDLVVVGVTFKELKLRSNVIDAYKGSKALIGIDLAEDEVPSNLSSAEDTLWLEDKSSRIQLEWSESEIARLTTGFVVAVRGKPTQDGKIQVAELCFPRLPAPSVLPARTSEGAPKGPFLALISGLAMGSQSDALAKARRSAIDFLLGKDGQELSAAVRQVVICGGTFAKQSELGEGGIKAALAQLEDLLASLVAEKAVRILPGKGEPTGAALPQLPFHRCLFRSLRSSNGLKTASNPCSFSCGGVDVVGHSGQPVEDLLRCTGIGEPLEALQRCLEARHLAPTAPDTLATRPFEDADPFVLETMPHVLFSGCHMSAAHSWRASGEGGTQCICVPSFQIQPAIVLVNLADPRDVRVHEFGALEPGA